MAEQIEIKQRNQRNALDVATELTIAYIQSTGQGQPENIQRIFLGFHATAVIAECRSPKDYKDLLPDMLKKLVE